MAVMAGGAGSPSASPPRHSDSPRFRQPLRVLLLLIAAAAAFRAEALPEFEVEGAFLLNFAKFVTWPPASFTAPESPITICIDGKNPFGAFIDEIVRGESVEGRGIAVRRLSAVPPAGVCQIVYMASGVDRLSDFPAGVLTVGEGAKFVREGGMIAFVLDHGHLRFLVNLPAADRAGLKISSRLLAVAKAVEK